MAPKTEEILKRTKELLAEEGIDLENKEITSEEMLREFILPGIKNSKDVLSSIYTFKSRKRGGALGNFKTKLQNKIINTVINVIEKQGMKQQKFNELTYRAIEKLIEENNYLRNEISDLKKKTLEIRAENIK